jgi:DNA polymerase III delta prime subunit
VSDLQFDVVGAQGARQYFASLTPETLSHAYVFSGPAGVGKRTFARRLAQSLLCTAPKSGVIGYDGTCSSCALFKGEQTHHPDFLEHSGMMKIGDRDSSMGFGEGEELTSRDLVRQLQLQSYGGGMRVLLLGDIDFAGAPAANALLKFLEEPPRGVVMILTTPSPGRLLPTIRSRALDVRFAPLSKAQVREILLRQGRSEAAADLGAALGAGSVTRAVAALEGEEESLRTAVARWFFEAVDGRTPQETWATRETLDDGIETIKTLVRDWIVGDAAASAPLAAPDQAASLRRLRPLEPAMATAVLAKIDDAQRLARTNVSPAWVSELVRMALTTTKTR